LPEFLAALDVVTPEPRFVADQDLFLLHDIDTVDVFIRFDRPGWCRFGGI
jgi:hypothetical protein